MFQRQTTGAMLWECRTRTVIAVATHILLFGHQDFSLLATEFGKNFANYTNRRPVWVVLVGILVGIKSLHVWDNVILKTSTVQK